jgi:hypothetical protein
MLGSDLGIKQREWKDLGEVSRGQQDISNYRSVIPCGVRAGINPAPTPSPAIPYGITGNIMRG